VALWHGDIGAAERRRILAERPDVLLTTPESIEAMLVSRGVHHERFFGSLRTVVISQPPAGDPRRTRVELTAQTLTYSMRTRGSTAADGIMRRQPAGRDR
jgi:hypothetical protein